MRYAPLAACAAAALFLSACLPNGRDFLPPEVADDVSLVHFRDLGEPALWTPQAASGYRTRMRLSMSGIVMTRIAIRIDERTDGRLFGRIVEVRYQARSRFERTVREFRPSRRDWIALQTLAREAQLWTIYPQFYVGDPDEICIDGMEIYLERVDGVGYRFSNGNVPCTAPLGMRRVAGRMMELADARHLLDWVELPR